MSVLHTPVDAGPVCARLAHSTEDRLLTPEAWWPAEEPASGGGDGASISDEGSGSVHPGHQVLDEHIPTHTHTHTTYVCRHVV